MREAAVAEKKWMLVAKGSQRKSSPLSIRFLDIGHGLVAHYRKFTARASKSDSSCMDPGFESRNILSIHCFHGFGANSYSFDGIQEALPRRIIHSSRSTDYSDVIMTAHDSPGFGLTSRPKAIGSYSQDSNARIGRAVQDAALKQYADGEQGQPKVRKALIGHSLGCISAALQILHTSQGIGGTDSDLAAESSGKLHVDGSVRMLEDMGEQQQTGEPNDEAPQLLVLVAPAILVWPWELEEGVKQWQSSQQGQDRGNQPPSTSNRHEPPISDSDEPSGHRVQRSGQRSQPGFLQKLLATCHSASILGLLALLRILRPVIIVILRILVRCLGLWEWSINNSQ